MNVATIYIPFSEAHKSIVENAFRSATQQTVKCDIVMEASPGTPALLRNRAVNMKTPFVVFLDSDDTLEPTFVEDCLQTYVRGQYVYTGWYEDDFVMMPRPCNPFLAHDFGDGRDLVGGYHLVTTLFPTSFFQVLGGFNEKLPGNEDTDFYMRAQSVGMCGLLCPKPLLHYTGMGTRSKAFRDNPDYQEIRRLIYERNGGLDAMAGCCGISGGGQTVKTDGAQPGDVAAQVLQPGTQRGRATNRWYERSYPGEIVMVAPEDVAIMPDVYKAIVTFREIAPTKEQALKAAGLID